MKRFILLFFVTFFAIDLVQAQDIIVPKDKTKSRLTVVLTKVSQETNGVVEYKDYNNQEGPTYSMPWNQINMIITIDGATIYPPVGAIPPPIFFIREPTATSAPISVGSLISVNSP